MTQEAILKATKVLSIIGIFLSSYLLYNYLTKPAFQPCTINETINCDAVTKGPVSTVLGVPVALVGLVGYCVILLSATLRKPRLVLVTALFGTAFCLRITYLEVFWLKVLCPVCLACQIDMIALTLLAILPIKDNLS